jgi:hypothetical protein
MFSHICHVDRHGHFTLKQLRLPVVNETHTNSYTGPRLTVEWSCIDGNYRVEIYKHLLDPTRNSCEKCMTVMTQPSTVIRLSEMPTKS